MAEVAVAETSSSNTFPFGRVQAKAVTKRKTPSELRGEQLKRRSCGTSTELQPTSFLVSDRSNGGIIHGLKKPDTFKSPRYIETRVDEVYPVKKSSERCRILYAKENSKDALPAIKKADDLKTPFVACNIGDKSTPQQSCERGETPAPLETSGSVSEDNADQSHCKFGKCSQSKLRSVSDLSSGCKMSSDATCINMDKALKGLVARNFSATSSLLADSSGLFIHQPSRFSRCYEFHIPSNKAPLDLTLKTTLRLVSSSSVKWCHRAITTSAYNGMCELNSPFFCSRDQNAAYEIQSSAAADVLYSNGLQSWVYPQSTLPPSVVSAMSLSASRPEKDFLMKRQQDWEDSFRTLYYMLRKSLCNIFYVYTSQFVVMFVGGKFLGNKKHSSNAYVSQSTHGLRSLLKENDIDFSMPLCHSEVEQATADDLVELSEIKRQNLGQTLHLDSSSDIDNSPQSLLALIGNKNVHGLFDFLLNYRFFLRSLTGIDVPVIYSPVPFQNGSIWMPEVRCKEIKRADAVFASSGSETDETESMPNSSANDMCYSIEIKDSIIPPWTVSQVCRAMGSDQRCFELSLMTEPISVGLNVVLDAICGKLDTLVEPSKCVPESSNTFGIPGTVVVPCLQSAFLKGLKYSNGSSAASVSPL